MLLKSDCSSVLLPACPVGGVVSARGMHRLGRSRWIGGDQCAAVAGFEKVDNQHRLAGLERALLAATEEVDEALLDPQADRAGPSAWAGHQHARRLADE